VFNAKYPSEILSIFEKKLKFLPVPEDDLKLLKKYPSDFIGINNYSCNRIGLKKKEDLDNIYNFFLPKKPEKGAEISEMGWEIYPEGLYDLLKRVNNDYGHPLIYITENGIACKDNKILNKVVQDDDRISYLKRYLEASHKAIKEGVNLKGYFVWSLMDNFEWIEGFSKRFGLIRINFETQERIWKKSAFWYRDLIRSNGFSI
jgi:beta-glucosidase